jgi:hypothetical protein
MRELISTMIYHTNELMYRPQISCKSSKNEEQDDLKE